MGCLTATPGPSPESDGCFSFCCFLELVFEPNRGSATTHRSYFVCVFRMGTTTHGSATTQMACLTAIPLLSFPASEHSQSSNSVVEASFRMSSDGFMRIKTETDRLDVVVAAAKPHTRALPSKMKEQAHNPLNKREEEIADVADGRDVEMEYLTAEDDSVAVGEEPWLLCHSRPPQWYAFPPFLGLVSLSSRHSFFLFFFNPGWTMSCIHSYSFFRTLSGLGIWCSSARGTPPFCATQSHYIRWSAT